MRGLGGEGRMGLGLTIDRGGPAFDATARTDLEAILNDATPAAPDSMEALSLLRHYRLSKYNRWRDARQGDLPQKPFVLLVDQVEGDASVAGAGGTAQSFEQMINTARDLYPDHTLVLRGHPRGRGHITSFLCPDVQILAEPINPWDVLRAADAVLTVSSQIGMEAIFAGHRPHLFGAAWYGGWGLTEDHVVMPAERRARLTPEKLFDALYRRYTHWHDPLSGAPISLMEALQRCDGLARAARHTTEPMVLAGMRPWKRAHVAKMLSAGGGHVRFAPTIEKARLTAVAGERPVIWASRADGQNTVMRLEDGVLRSRGLGAQLVPALSLMLDPDGIAFDAIRPSRLEQAIAESPGLPPAAIARAAALRTAIVDAALSKYNTSTAPDQVGDGPWTLVVGQVEDDASLRLGGGTIRTNQALLAAARARFPNARLLYRPHPDVVAGLRDGRIGAEEADAIDAGGSLEALWPQLERVVTMTSTTGFEALLRSVPVSVFGWPFYAGWGLTDDRGPKTAMLRRGISVSLDGLVHAALIEAPMYRHPREDRPASPEEIVAHLAEQGPPVRLSWGAKLQGAALRFGPFWR